MNWKQKLKYPPAQKKLPKKRTSIASPIPHTTLIPSSPSPIPSLQNTLQNFNVTKKS